MAPLVVNEIISANTNLFLALLIGIAFGFVLESSGFSSSRKLAGMFYGYDASILKVFFTAAITAMLGMLFLSLFGWMDLSLIYINPTFLYSAIVGGIIMGVGFIMGGFCPGTAFCAIAIGKLDALAFIGGLMIGVFGFAELFPYFENLYFAQNMGSPTINEWLDISKGTFALILIIAAFLMFWLSEIAEKKFPRKDY